MPDETSRLDVPTWNFDHSSTLPSSAGRGQGWWNHPVRRTTIVLWLAKTTERRDESQLRETTLSSVSRAKRWVGMCRCRVPACFADAEVHPILQVLLSGDNSLIITDYDTDVHHWVPCVFCMEFMEKLCNCPQPESSYDCPRIPSLTADPALEYGSPPIGPRPPDDSRPQARRQWALYP